MLHNVVSRDEWLAARMQHLEKEKELTRLRDQLSAERRTLRLQHFRGVRVERAGDGRAAVLVRACHGRIEDRAMPEVHTVEHAERDDARTRVRREGLGRPDDPHGGS